MEKKKDLRVEALARFAGAITILNLAGYIFLGFEPSILHPIVALITGYSVELFLESITSRAEKRKPNYVGGIKKFIVFLLPAHITSLAISMLIFTNENLFGLIFAVIFALASKTIFRVIYKGKSRHFLNPSNTGIVAAFVFFPWIGAAPPYHFTTNLHGIGDWIIICIFILLGSFLNFKYTKKIPLIASWLIGYVIISTIRTLTFDTSTIASLSVTSGVAFILFTFYMVSDPSTTPMKLKNQIIFGFSVALIYGITMEMHIVFNLFFSLFFVCLVRGICMFFENKFQNSEQKKLIKA